LQPEYATAQHNLAAALERQGHFDEAIVHYRLALHLRPDLDLASRRLEALLSQQGGH
jgi:tetratricopeptide (TPR) repeat protein